MEKPFVKINENQWINLLLIEGVRLEGETLKLDVGDCRYTASPEYRDRVLAVLESLTDDGVRGPRR